MNKHDTRGRRRPPQTNWILLQKHETLPETIGVTTLVTDNAPAWSHGPEGESIRYAYKPLVVQTAAADPFSTARRTRVTSMNRLNERIRDSLVGRETETVSSLPLKVTRATSTSSPPPPSLDVADRVVDEHFDFIRHETEFSLHPGNGPGPGGPGTGVVEHRDSAGSVDAVFEKRPGGTRRDLLPPPRSTGPATGHVVSVPRPPLEQYARAASDPLQPRAVYMAMSAPTPAVGEPSTSHFAMDGSSRTRRIPIRMVRRSDSLDSGSLRLGMQAHAPSEFVAVHPLPSPSAMHSDVVWHRTYRSRYKNPRRPSVSEHRHRVMRTTNVPTLLRRDSFFYSKCDVCMGVPRLDGLPCPACEAPRRRPRPRALRRVNRQHPMPGATDVYELPPAPPAPPTSRRQSQSKRRPTGVTIEPYFESGASSEGPVLNDESSSVSEVAKDPGNWNAATLPADSRALGGLYSRPRRTLDVEDLPNIAQSYVPSAYRSPRPPPPPVTYKQPPTTTTTWKAMNMNQDNRVYSTHPAPVFRYGTKPMPKWLYDYDAYAEEQRQKEALQRRQRIVLITLLFLIIALLVAAGIVWAALR